MRCSTARLLIGIDRHAHCGRLRPSIAAWAPRVADSDAGWPLPPEATVSQALQRTVYAVCAEDEDGIHSMSGLGLLRPTDELGPGMMYLKR